MHIWRLIAYLQSIDRSSDISWAAEMDPIAAGVDFLHFAIEKTFQLQGAPLEQMTNICILEKTLSAGNTLQSAPLRFSAMCNLSSEVFLTLFSRTSLFMFPSSQPSWWSPVGKNLQLLSDIGGQCTDWKVEEKGLQRIFMQWRIAQN